MYIYVCIVSKSSLPPIQWHQDFPIWGSVKRETLSRGIVCKLGQHSFWRKLKVHFPRQREARLLSENACNGAWLIHFYKTEESKFAVWLVHITLSWLVRVPDWLLWTYSDWSINKQIKIFAAQLCLEGQSQPIGQNMIPGTQTEGNLAVQCVAFPYLYFQYVREAPVNNSC